MTNHRRNCQTGRHDKHEVRGLSSFDISREPGVATGPGFAIMSRFTVAKEVRLGELVEVALSPPLVRQLSVVHPREGSYSRLIEGFVPFAKQKLAAIER